MMCLFLWDLDPSRLDSSLDALQGLEDALQCQNNETTTLKFKRVSVELTLILGYLRGYF